MKKRIISILLALSMTVSAGVSALAAPSDIPFEQRAMAVDTIKADKAIEAFESDLKKSNNYDKVFEDYKSLMDLSVEISDIMNLNWAETEKLNYGMNTTSTREELDKNYNECSEYREKIDEQTHGQQHLLLYIPSLIMLTLISIRHITKEWALVGISLLALVHSVNVYIPRTQPHNIQEIKHMALIPNFSMLPVSRDDTDEILALKKKLDTTVYDGDTLGVLASSFTLNEDILINAEPSLGVKSIRDNYIVSLPQVDSRDRDLTPLYTVNYVLVASPAQTHLAEGSQTVVKEAVNSFMNYADIATAYEEVPECETVIDGITIKLFHRVRDEHQADIKTFEARLYK